MQNAFEVVNKIPVRTWRWLHVNDTTVEDQPEVVPYTHIPIEHFPEGVVHRPIDQAILPDMGEERIDDSVMKFMKQSHNHGYFIEIPDDTVIEQPITLVYACDEQNPTLLDETFILMGRKSKASFVIQYEGQTESPLFHCGVLRVMAGEEANAQIIRTQMFAERDTHIDYVSARVDARANISVIVADLGAKQTVGNINIELLGDESEAAIDSLFLGAGTRRLDYNYRIALHGKRARAEIQGHGVLLDRCKKLFRGTIDFLRGASGSKGSESEYVVLLSKESRNLSVPLLLCAEEDVEGAHAASAGKIDEKKLFYLMTRGLSEQEAKKLIAEAEFAPVVEKIPDENLRGQISARVKRSLEHVK